jgi:hypothetical protein
LTDSSKNFPGCLLPSSICRLIHLFYCIILSAVVLHVPTEKIRTPRILGGSLVLAFIVLVAWGLLPHLPDHTLRISYLDVGQEILP